MEDELQKNETPEREAHDEVASNGTPMETDNTIYSDEPIMHKEILKELLAQVHPVSLAAVIGMGPDDRMQEKHYQVAVVKVLLAISKRCNWNLREQDGYVYVYNGAYWMQFNKAEIRKFLSDAATKMGMPEYDAKAYKFVDGLFKQFLSDAYFVKVEPDSQKILINLQNGTFEFTSDGWVLRQFDPADFLTYQLPFAYEPSATCPLFDSYLKKVMPDECSCMVLQEFSGYIFTKFNMEKCLVLTGEGSNGKSVFFNILTALVGIENSLNYSLSCFNQEGNRAKLTTALVNYSSETNFKVNPEIFKALVSGEPLQARELYCKPFTLRNKVRFIMNCNKLPTETENTVAYFRRFIIVPFEVTITEEERDIKLAQKIINAELPGVFNWLLLGLHRLIENQKFTACEKAELAMVEFKKQSDSVQLFIDEYTYVHSPSSRMTLVEIYAHYEDFCKADKMKPLGRNQFSRSLEKKGFDKKKGNMGTFFEMAIKPQK